MRAIEDMSPESWANQIKENFGRLLQDEESWLAVQKKLSIGDVVTGRVVGRAPFGVWLDIGVGYLALLEVGAIYQLDFNYKAYCANAWGSIGTEVTARVIQFRDDPSKEIRLVQDRVQAE